MIWNVLYHRPTTPAFGATSAAPTASAFGQGFGAPSSTGTSIGLVAPQTQAASPFAVPTSKPGLCDNFVFTCYLSFSWCILFLMSIS